MRRLLITALHKTTLSSADAKAPQPVYILGGVVAPTVLGTAGKRQSPESLAEPEPARAYAELVGGLANRECMLLFEHTATVRL